MRKTLYDIESIKISKIRKFVNQTLQKFNLAIMRYSTYKLLIEENKNLRRLTSLDISMLSTRFIGFLLKQCKNSYSQLYQDLVVLYLVKNFLIESPDKLVFIEFGACDGEKFSNSLLLEKNGWIGIIAEPSRKWHKDLFLKRNCFISKKCVASSSGELMSFMETKEPEFSSLEIYSNLDDLASYRVANIINTDKVETITLNDLIKESGIKDTITYLSVDTEGGELEILQSFDFNAYLPAIITVEHNYSVARPNLNNFLSEKGYILILEGISHFESWFVHPSKIRIPFDKVF